MGDFSKEYFHSCKEDKKNGWFFSWEIIKNGFSFGYENIMTQLIIIKINTRY